MTKWVEVAFGAPSLANPRKRSQRPMVPSWLLDEVAQQLESQAERPQIHQLTFAANQHRWPQDSNVLDLYRLRDLVQDLTRNYSSFEELKQSLRHALSLAPESKAFVPAARTLLKVAKQAYQGDSSAAALPTEASLSEFPPTLGAEAIVSPFETRASNPIDNPLPTQPYDQIAATLEQSPSATRIKKLLYAVCSGEWSNDPVMLGRFRLSNLLKQLHKMSPNEEALHKALRNVVVTLNRQMEYELVAQLIQRECQKLYAPQDEIAKQASYGTAQSNATHIDPPGPAPSNEAPFNSTLGSGVDPVPLGFYDDDEGPEPTGILIPGTEVDTPVSGWETSPNSGSTPDTGPKVKASPSEPTEAWATPDYNPSYASSPQGDVAEASAGTVQAAQTLDWQGLAELRVELMRYANPLRVKALMFSTLYYPFDANSDSDWSKLQTETLGDLILRLMEQFQQHSSLEEQLQLVASRLMPNDEYGNAAGAIIRALRPFYP